MNTNSKNDLRQLAKDCLDLHDTDDAWAIYRDEANARYAAEDDGDHADYTAQAVAIFEEAKIATVDLGDDDDDGGNTDNVIEHPAAAAKRQADERAARNAEYAEREAAARKERSKHRAELKKTKPKRDAEKKYWQDVRVTQHRSHVAAITASDLMTAKKFPDGGDAAEYYSFDKEVFLKVLNACAEAAEAEAAKQAGYPSWAALKAAFEKYENGEDTEAVA